MIEKLEIENYRGIAHGEISGLAPLTILVGPNSSGKSTVLEALLLSASPDSGDAMVRAALRRGWVGVATTVAMLPTGVAHFKVKANGVEHVHRVTGRSPSFSHVVDQVVKAQISLQGPGNYSASGRGPAASLIEVQSADVDPAELDAAVSRA